MKNRFVYVLVINGQNACIYSSFIKCYNALTNLRIFFNENIPARIVKMEVL